MFMLKAVFPLQSYGNGTEHFFLSKSLDPLHRSWNNDIRYVSARFGWSRKQPSCTLIQHVRRSSNWAIFQCTVWIQFDQRFRWDVRIELILTSQFDRFFNLSESFTIEVKKPSATAWGTCFSTRQLSRALVKTKLY